MIINLKKRKKQKALKNIRVHFESFGYDLSNVTDEDIEKGIIFFAQKWNDLGITMEEMIGAYKILLSPKKTPNQSFNRNCSEKPSQSG